ncbi:hypothetical protein [Ralstonia mannitolilytica]|uniref:Uncharacterized protein n=1 Tax=Ralstonia mannitolilytica TaxID=105219 RepID=A0AAJ4ZIL8_9RALS|nr:hypothetical protein [Ralstonia mannitolilytica]CAG2153218.1 hypothetical protein LMG6866_04399 [Ralstonia mannitolilytica]SUD89580.1 Uncharacterised protein [Ralstonia mannitolilytica]SUD95960.1 Uncharacterised protein [Ralstonia mannitolilytica]
MGYTLAQVRGLLAAHGRLERRQNALRLALHAVAAQGDRAAIERLQRELWEDVQP